MILKAHCGVGILGKEGMQAARSADYAIGEFKFLKRLLFVHGREAYRRNSYVLLYNFYKNVVYIEVQVLMAVFQIFSGGSIYDSVLYQMYNITMTSIPIFWFAMGDY